MYKVCSIFSQVLKLFSRGEFEKAVKEHKAERHARGFTSWGQFMAMLFCQLGRAHSLREICGGLACCEGQLKHLGVPVAPKKSTLAYANEHRPWELYQTVFEQTLFKCQELVASQGGRKKFRFKNKLMSLDGSIIDLSVSMFDWAKFRRTKGAIKLHLLLDHDGYPPDLPAGRGGAALVRLHCIPLKRASNPLLLSARRPSRAARKAQAANVGAVETVSHSKYDRQSDVQGRASASGSEQLTRNGKSFRALLLPSWTPRLGTRRRRT